MDSKNETIISEEYLLSQFSGNSSANQIEQEVVPSMAEKKDNKKLHILEIKLNKVVIGCPDMLCKPTSSSCCIYRVPEKLREGNETLYTPRVVSIGPYHHAIEKYDAMEKVKLKVLSMLINESTKPVDYFLGIIKNEERTVRACYSEEVAHLAESDKFVSMMLVDAVFIIKFFDTFSVRSFENNLGEDEKYSLFINRENVAEINHDLRLLENQLPLYFIDVVKQLFSKNRKVKRRSNHLSVKSLAADFWPLPSHMTSRYLATKKQKAALRGLHFLHQHRCFYLPTNHIPNRKKPAPELTHTYMIRSAKKLQEAGVKVKAQNDPREDLAMFKSIGNLKVLPLEIDDTSETTYCNIMAFEQRHFPDDQTVSDYIILMEMLIRDDSEEILVNNRVIVNRLSGGVTATTFLRNLCKNVTYSAHPFSLEHLCKAVEKQCDNRTRKFKAALSNALRIGGSILLFLTVLQTIFSALALYLDWKASSL